MPVEITRYLPGHYLLSCSDTLGTPRGQQGMCAGRELGIGLAPLTSGVRASDRLCPDSRGNFILYVRAHRALPVSSKQLNREGQGVQPAL